MASPLMGDHDHYKRQADEEQRYEYETDRGLSSLRLFLDALILDFSDPRFLFPLCFGGST